MVIIVRTYGHLNTFIPNAKHETRLTLRDNSTVGDAVYQVGIGPDDIWVCVIDRKLVEMTHKLHDGDILNIIPPIDGGGDD